MRRQGLGFKQSFVVVTFDQRGTGSAT